MNYYNYFDKSEHVPEEVSMDEFIAEATRTDVIFKSPEEELKFLRTARVTQQLI